MTHERLLLLMHSSGGFDPSQVPLEVLAKIRGAMWSVRAPIPFGPRPNDPSNIVAMDYLEKYSLVDQRTMIAAYSQREHYTHCPVGPLVDPDGYHGKYPPTPDLPTQESWERFLDCLQLLWNAGIIPIFFLKPDNWDFPRTKSVFEPFLLQPRSQRLIRVIVPMGWEPDYNMSSFTHAAMDSWIRSILPKALVLLHLPADRDAPVGTDAMGDDNGKDNREGWNRVSPFLHGFLIQNGPYEVLPDQNPELKKNFAAQFHGDEIGAETHSLAWHFEQGIWKKQSAWGPTTRIKLYAGEQTAYHSFWHNLPERVSWAWGDWAMANGADGYFDGGTA